MCKRNWHFHTRSSWPACSLGILSYGGVGEKAPPLPSQGRWDDSSDGETRKGHWPCRAHFPLSLALFLLAGYRHSGMHPPPRDKPAKSCPDILSMTRRAFNPQGGRRKPVLSMGLTSSRQTDTVVLIWILCHLSVGSALQGRGVLS